MRTFHQCTLLTYAYIGDNTVMDAYKNKATSLTTITRCQSDQDKARLTAFFRQNKEKLAHNDFDQCYVLQQSGSMIGALKLETIKQPNCLFLRNVLVDEAHRKQGIGKRLLKHLPQIIENKSCFCLCYLPLVTFYQHCGFETVDIDKAAEIFQRRFYRYNKKANNNRDKTVVLMILQKAI